MMNFGLLILIIQICPVMYELVTLSIYFGNHLILLINTCVTIAHILLRLVCRFYTIVRTSIATLRLTTSS